MGTQKDQQLLITAFGRLASGKEEKRVCPQTSVALLASSD